MLKRLKVNGFKSLDGVDVEFPRLTVLFGPNAAGKSNLLEAVQALSRIGTSRTLSEALTEPLRGYAIEAFSFPPGGLAALLSQDAATFSLKADLSVGKDLFGYEAEIRIQPGSGSLSVQNEYLVAQGQRGKPKGTAIIELADGELRVRRKSKPAHPRQEPLGLNHTLLSDPRLGGLEYLGPERCRRELEGWRIYYLDPRVAMRVARPPADVSDIGVLGEDIAPFLFRLSSEEPQRFTAIKRTLRSLIPSVEDLTVDLDKRRGTLDIQVRQDGAHFSSRIISEGTLRVLALCAIAANPWNGSLLAFEEPENGVHPRRLELIAHLLTSLAIDSELQIIVTTHSPLFCDAMLKKAREYPQDIALLNVRRGSHGTEVHAFDVPGELFDDPAIAEALTAPTEDGVFEGLLMRGMLDD